jgi:hypothetical protein
VHFEENTLINERENGHESLIIKEVQLLLAEKRTSLKASPFPHENPQARNIGVEFLKMVGFSLYQQKPGVERRGETEKGALSPRRRVS